MPWYGSEHNRLNVTEVSVQQSLPQFISSLKSSIILGFIILTKNINTKKYIWLLWKQEL